MMYSLVNKSPAFVTTQWTLVLCAGGDDSPAADEALEKLCRAYWYPLYVFIRRGGATQHDAEDLTQAFFARLLEKGYLCGLDRNKGKFRSYLLAAFQNFAANHRRDAHAQKRGGRCSFISLNDTSNEEAHLQKAFADTSAEKSFERQWAMTLLQQVVARLRDEFVAADKTALFGELKIFLTGDKRSCSYADLATRLGTTQAAMKMAVSRMRQRYGELLRVEIANTLSCPEEVEEELRALFAALSG
jgi:DNA-directed RNA polymerase specialized sigma24 family protein